jgi:hypothetical protein
MIPLSAMAQWKELPVSLAELRIDTVLRCGQSFRWRQLDDEWFVLEPSSQLKDYCRLTRRPTGIVLSKAVLCR